MALLCEPLDSAVREFNRWWDAMLIKLGGAYGKARPEERWENELPAEHGREELRY
jgi:hypothetical protein